MLRKLLIIAFLLVVGISGFTRSLDDILRSGVIYVAFTRSSYNSINRYIAEEFAKYLDVKMVPVFTTWDENFSNNGKIPPDLETNPNISYTPDALKKADFICGTIYVFPWRKKLFDYAGIMYVSDLLVVRKQNVINPLLEPFLPKYLVKLIKNSGIKVRTYRDLKGMKIALLGNSSYQKDIQRINKQIGGGIQIVLTQSEEQSQRLMESGKVDGFVAVSYLALKYLKTHPQARLAFPVGKPFKVGWAVQKGNYALEKEINNFFENLKGSGKLDQLFLKYYGIDYKTYLEIINSYAQAQSYGRDLDEILQSGRIIVAVRDRDMIYHPHGPKQFSTYLAEAFAKYLGVKLVLVVAPNLATYFEDSQGKIVKDSSYTPEFMKKVDVVCDLLEPVPWRLNKVDIIGYLPMAKVVVARKGLKIRSVADLKKLRGVTAKGSSYEQALIDNGIKNYFYAPASDLLKIVQEGKADYTLISFIYSLPKYPDLEAKFIIGDIKKVGWAIKRNQPKLRQKILEFFDYAKKTGLLDKYFKKQTGMPFKAVEKYLTALYQTYNIGIFPFVQYETDQGLPQENIQDIFQDTKGYIWFATLGGAVRFNGRKMRVFTTNNGLLSNEVFDIDEDTSSKTIYFATLRGISTYKNYKFDSLITDHPFRRIFIDPYNNKWFYGDYGAVILTNKNHEIDLNYKFSHFPQSIKSVVYVPKLKKYLLATNKGLYAVDISFNSFQKLSSKVFFDLFVDEDQNIWLSGDDGLYFNDSAQTILSGSIGRKINRQLKIGNDIISKIIQSRDGAIWLISNFRAYQIFSLQQTPIVYDQNIGLSGQKILSFFSDNEENYWFGFSGGVQKLSNRSLRIIYPTTLKYYVHSLEFDKNNQLWIAFTNSLYVLGDNLIKLSSKLNSEEKSYAVDLGPDDNMLVASTNALYLIDTKTFKIVKKHQFKNELPQVEKVFISSNGQIFILTGSSGVIYYLKNFNAEPVKLESPLTAFVYQLTEYDGLIVGGNSTGLIYFNGKKFKVLRNLSHTVWTLKVINDTLYVGTEQGLGIFTAGNFHLFRDIDLPNKCVTAIEPASDKNHLWIGTNKGFCYVNMKDHKVEFTVDANDGLPGNEIAFDGLRIDSKGLLWVGTLHGIANYDIKKMSMQKYAPNCQIEAIYLNGEEVYSLPKVLKYSQNNITFELTGLSFKNEESLMYQYYLRGLKNKYFPGWKGNSYKATFQNLPPGNYVFAYRAKGKDGIWSYYKDVRFQIEKPIWQKTWFIILMIILFISAMYVLIKLREKALKKRNEMLERLVAERTREIELQKVELEQKNAELQQQQEEIIAQRDELARQRDLARKQRDEIQRQQEAIMDSIYYAKRIQSAILTPKEQIKKFIPEFFILYMPRDIVSGDFYWFKKVGDQIIVAAADCTGHGVPGAFMSMLGIALLEEIVMTHRDNLKTGLILDTLRERIIESLHQTGKIEEAKDGMDIALYILNTKTLRLQYSGAFNPLIIIRNGVLYELKANRMPIGIFEDVNDHFDTIYFDTQTNDMIYSFSDGYASQFGGKNGKKFRLSRLRKLLLTISERSMEEQYQALVTALKNWMGVAYEQVDDILVIGVKVVWKQTVKPQPLEQDYSKFISVIRPEELHKKKKIASPKSSDSQSKKQQQ